MTMMSVGLLLAGWHQCDCQDGRCGFKRECGYFTCVDEGDEPNRSGDNPSASKAYKKLAGEDRCVAAVEESAALSSPDAHDEKRSIGAAPHHPARKSDSAGGSSSSYLVGMGALVMLLSGAAGSAGTLIFLRRRGQTHQGDGRAPRSHRLYEGIDMGDISASEALTEGTEELLVSTP